jgi:dolichyl-phosphate beta-glucosyltransferase
VRQGFLRGFAGAPTPDSVGFWDADLATPLADIGEFQAVLDGRPALLAVFGSRVNLLGRSVKRRLARHYVGRVFATAASAMLRLPIYDTQCGAKLFRNTPEVRATFAERFVSRWIFDVELIARLRDELAAHGGPAARDVIYEFPLMVWRDVAGSKLRARHFVTVFVDLCRIWASSGRRR